MTNLYNKLDYESPLFGEKPTFVLKKTPNEPYDDIALYETLPADFLESKKERYKGKTNSLGIYPRPIGNVVDYLPEEWNWDTWKINKIGELSSSRSRFAQSAINSILSPENKEVLDEKGELFMRESTGVQLTLLFLALRRVNDKTRMEDITDRIKTMDIDECYYWYSKCTSPTEPYGVKAFRTLISG